ncbi:MAG: AAA domain-containing protein [Planctomycetota bacterium]
MPDAQETHPQPAPENAVLAAMLDRLYASLMRGPGLNCRPNRSRQRIDLTQLDDFDDLPFAETLVRLLGNGGVVRLDANVPRPADWSDGFWKKRKRDNESEEADPGERSTEDRAAHAAYARQRKLLAKLRNLSDDARTYVQETGVHALNVGYPLLSVPPGTFGSGRLLAPIAFVPIRLAIKAGGRPGLELECFAADADRVVPNPALMAWIARNAGVEIPDELFADEQGDQPWTEIQTLIDFVANALELEGIDAESFVPPQARPQPPAEGEEPSDEAAGLEPEPFVLQACPNAEGLPDVPAVLPIAVMGLFPAGNQGLIRDTRAMLEKPHELEGPVLPFVSRTAAIEPPTPSDHAEAEEPSDETPDSSEEDHQSPRPVALADPCQLRATTLARTHRALVLHGPPGTGKSQTITNIIGDHLARGQRVLFVCDKRTALDVVAHRLDALGLSSLCALVHDPARDQRDLYMGIRAQLERLVDAETHPRAEKRLEQIDREMAAIHGELSELHAALMHRRDDRPGLAAESFSDLLGRWLGIDAPPLPDVQLDSITTDDLEAHRRSIEVALERGAAIVFPNHPWTHAAGGTLENYLATPVEELRRRLASCVEDARVADTTAHSDIPPFLPEAPLQGQADRRADLLEHLRWLHEHPDETRFRHAASLDRDALPRMADKLKDTVEHRAHLEKPLDDELWLGVRDQPPTLRQINEQLGALRQYLDAAGKWWGFLAFGAKSRAAAVLREHGLTRTPELAARLADFLDALRARVLLAAAVETLTGVEPTSNLPGDAELSGTLRQFDHLLPTLRLTEDDPVLADALKPALLEEKQRASLIAGLKQSPARSAALRQLEATLRDAELFNADWLARATGTFRAFSAAHAEAEERNGQAPDTPPRSPGKPALPTLQRLQERFDDLETVLRIRDGLASMPEQLRAATANLLEAAVPADRGVAALTKRIIEHTLQARVAANPALARLDPQAIDHAFARYADLEAERRDKAVDAVLHSWSGLQRRRLLVGTGTKLNSLGASVRQRLYVRGKRAMKLRQVVEVGQNANYDDGGGDPIFDLCPVWLASPETVAQCLPRTPLFDVVIFDEASQCRLEEALPVLTRGHRVVIAGDPKQLPPTRFFEAAVSSSDDIEIKDEDDLFEAQQTEVEDLLAASLNLDVQESYLDVHYRSRNADLIEFSNEHFYKGRLQAIPGHPNRNARFAPLTLHRADGIYEDRVNPGEAERVVQLVDDLLKRAEPPSIGIACFNLAQRDLIAEALDDRAMGDDAFARRLEQARNRDSDSSFEGLFVKNLENVQGDERDHIIVSTTYGPNEQGKFYRRFGPLAMPGGGRRLNVLVTRARHEVHLVTSIPQSAYLNAEPVPEGATPSGSWLLFAYLRYAEQLEDAYEQMHRLLENQEPGQAASRLMTTEGRSRFAEALGRRLAEQRGVGSDVCWGNEGFCVDLALRDPEKTDAVTVGALTDFSRYAGPSDAVSWDLYRVGILRWQGWRLHRLWSPTLFRDPQRSVNRLLEDAQAVTGRSDNA